MINYLALLLAVIKAVGSVFQFLSQKQLLDAGAAQVISTALQDQAHAITTADEVRKAVRAAAAADPASVLRDNDGFRRD